MVKKKDSKPTSGSRVETTPSSSLTASPSGGSTPLNVCNTQATDWYKVHLPFKNPHFKRTFSQSVVISGKKRQWKGLKQIIAQEALEPTQSVSYNSIDAPPSFKPAKKYSDISGLEANYTDPHTKLHYANIAEFKIIKKLPSDLVGGYLTLRRANTQLQ